MKRMVIAGSPRAHGRSAHLAEVLFDGFIEECPDDEIYLVPVCELEIGPCIGCNACRARAHAAVQTEGGDEATDTAAEEEGAEGPSCVFDDDMQVVYDLLPDIDELIVVSPVYFSGAPSPMKALLDRLQPYFWTDARHAKMRPATLHIVGEGHDPCGFNALISEVKSATLVAGFRLERVLSWVGKITEEGDIIAEPEQVLPAEEDESAYEEAAAAEVPQGETPQGEMSKVAQKPKKGPRGTSGKKSVQAKQAKPGAQAKQVKQAKSGAQPKQPKSGAQSKQASQSKQGKVRPKLDLSAPARKAKGKPRG